MPLYIPEKASLWHRSRFFLLLAGVGLILLAAVIFSWQQLVFGAQQPINIGVADNGIVTEQISGQGRLLPRYSNSVMAEVDGVIQAIHLYPGSETSQGSVILSMRNPLLHRDKERAELAVLEASAALEAATARFEREKIMLENDVAILEAEIRFAEQELSTLQALLDQQIIARLDYLRAQTKLEQSRLKFTLSQRNLIAFQQARQADERAYQYRLQEAQKQFEMVMYDINQLQVRADSQGLLNEFSEQIEIGKPVRRGDIIAQITDPETLYADIAIAANEVSKVQLGQTVKIKVRQHIVEGQVIRVHPSVQHNQIRIEVELLGAAPEIARPNLDVSADITLIEVQDVIRAPTVFGLRSGVTEYDLFVRRGDAFYKRKVKIGAVSREFMEITQGLNIGEQFLIDPPKHLTTKEVITTQELSRG